MVANCSRKSPFKSVPLQAFRALFHSVTFMRRPFTCFSVFWENLLSFSIILWGSLGPKIGVETPDPLSIHPFCPHDPIHMPNNGLYLICECADMSRGEIHLRRFQGVYEPSSPLQFSLQHHILSIRASLYTSPPPLPLPWRHTLEHDCVTVLYCGTPAKHTLVHEKPLLEVADFETWGYYEKRLTRV